MPAPVVCDGQCRLQPGEPGGLGETGWITRVPETLAEANRVLRAVVTEAMTAVENGYRILPLGNTYSDMRQRWLLVYSQQAYERESQQLDKRVARAAEAAEKRWRR